MDNRRMCPHCRAFITSSDRVCPYCGHEVGRRVVDRRDNSALIGGLIPAAHFITALILLINIAMFAASCLQSNSIMEMDGQVLWTLGAKFGPSIWLNHEYWRLVTAGFLHGGLMHIGFNAWAIYVVGAQVEEVFGAPRYLVIYFASTVCGYILSARMNMGLSIGASAGIMGLIGAMIALGHAAGTPLGRSIRNQYLFWLALNLAWGLMPGSQIDNYAHIGGFAAGFGLAWFGGTQMRTTPSRETFWRIAAGACVLITAVCFFLMFQNYHSPDQLRQLR
jgi:rhomboid protease GluP